MCIMHKYFTNYDKHFSYIACKCGKEYERSQQLSLKVSLEEHRQSKTKDKVEKSGINHYLE